MAARPLVSFLFALLVSAGPALAQEQRIELTRDADYFGFDLRTERDVTLEQCQAACLGDDACRALTYNSNAGWCFLKSDFGELRAFPGAIAGRVVDVAGDADMGAAPSLAFLPNYLAEEALRYRADLLREGGDAEAGVAELAALAEQAVADGNPMAAIGFYRRALAATPDEARLWLSLAEAAMAAGAMPDVNSWSLKQAASAAAILGYRATRHRGERAEALSVLGAALEWREVYRPAISAYAASLELVDDASVRARYDSLRQRRGFRVVGHTIDADARVPRVCVQFSEPLLKAGVNYADYLSLDGAAPASLDTGERELCAEGLQHGRRYALQVRAGLPSAIGEAIESPVNLDLYVRDRSPSVRFTGDNFVLPGKGRHGIPLVTVNTERVHLELFRIGDRALSGIVNRSQFLRQLGGYELQRLGEESGERVWTGSIETALEQNRETVTSFPVDEALERRRPGIYVLAARPDGALTNDWDSVATQWFVVSDLGLAAVSGDDGTHVHVRSLSTARPLAGIELSLVARSNEVLGTAVTDADGAAVFPAGLMRGAGGMAPQLILARGGDDDFVFLDLTRAGFDLSDRGVEGLPAPGPIHVMTWTERGIYRAGERVHATALARDRAARAIDGLPLTFLFRRPDGVEYQRLTSTDPALGGHVVTLDLPDNAMRGAWTLQVHTDPDQPPVAETPFLVEDFIPDRIEFDLAAEGEMLTEGEPLAIRIDGRFLYGAPGAGLVPEGEAVLRPARRLASHPGYRFGIEEDDEGETLRVDLGGLAPLDENGQGTAELFVDRLPATTGLTEALVTIRLREAGGRAVERRLTLPARPAMTVIGVAPAFEGDTVPENSQAGFRLIALPPDGARAALDGVEWTLLSINRDYQWYRSDTGWSYETVDHTTLLDSGTIDIGAGEPAILSLPVEWGRYRLEVASADGALTSIDFSAGWFVEPASTETPDGLEISLDRDSYRPGDTARLRVSPRFGGQLLVTVGADTVLETIQAEIPEEGGTVDIPVGDDWGAGAYVTAMLFRPGETVDTRMPARAIGVKWLAIDPGERRLDLRLDTAARIGSAEPLRIDIRLANGVAGQPAMVTVAAVDAGILNLTRYEAPDPASHYFGQRRMGLQIRDIYGRLIDGSAGTVGRLRSGGDGAAMRAEGSPPTEALVAFHSGVVELDDQGRATVTFDMPPFNGTVRLMAVAWTEDGVGNAETEVIVRDPVVITASLPKFLAPGDRGTALVELANVDGPAGRYRIEAVAEGPLELSMPAREIELAAGGRSALHLPVSALAPGEGRITLRLAGEAGIAIEQSHVVAVRPATPLMTRRIAVPLAANGGRLRLDGELLAGNLTGGASVSIDVGPAGSIDVPGLLMALERYPYGCAEQLTSRAMPLLYLSELAELSGLEPDPQAESRVQEAVKRLLSYQNADGGFGMWGPESGDFWLDAYVTDFLTRAREQRFAVPDIAMRLALDNLQNRLAYTDDVSAEGPAIAYALYVLARNRRATAGDLRYYADTRLGQFGSAMARAQIAASLALYGDTRRADAAFTSAYALAASGADNRARGDFGSALRDNAAVVALASETGRMPAPAPRLLELVDGRRETTSTQEQAWMLLAARAMSSASVELAIDGQGHSGRFSRRLAGEELIAAPIEIVNRGPEAVEATITLHAAPEKAPPAGGNGFTIERSYYTLDGEPANISAARQNERYVVVLRIVEENAWPSRVLVTDLLPAGLEIDNPRLVSSADLAGFDWLPETEAVHQEFRSDRFVAAFDRTAASDRVMTLAYVVLAVTPGEYAHPAAQVEDMYRPELSARTAAGFLSVEAR